MSCDCHVLLCIQCAPKPFNYEVPCIGCIVGRCNWCGKKVGAVAGAYLHVPVEVAGPEAKRRGIPLRRDTSKDPVEPAPEVRVGCKGFRIREGNRSLENFLLGKKGK